MLDFHAAIRWCLPTVSQYFVSVPYSREQSSCHIKFLLGARLSCGHQVVLTRGIPVLCQYPIFMWAVLLPILAVAYQGMKYHKKCIRKLCTPNCNNVIQKLDLNRKSLTGKIASFVFLFCLFHFLDLNQILNPFQQLHTLHHERPFSMGMVHRVGSCIQLPLQLLYFPCPMPITEDVVAINGNGNKQKQKKATRRSKQVPLY